MTSKDIPGYRIEAVLGEVMGMTVRSANIGPNIVTGSGGFGGGEVNGALQQKSAVTRH